MFDPEFARVFVGGREGQRVALRVREECRVEVAAELPFLAKFRPFLEVFGFELVTVSPLAILEDRIACVKVHLRRAGYQAHHLIQVRHQLFGSPSASGIVACCLNAAGEGLAGVGVEASNVIALPAMQRDGNIFQLRDRRVSVNT